MERLPFSHRKSNFEESVHVTTQELETFLLDKTVADVCKDLLISKNPKTLRCLACTLYFHLNEKAENSVLLAAYIEIFKIACMGSASKINVSKLIEKVEDFLTILVERSLEELENGTDIERTTLILFITNVWYEKVLFLQTLIEERQKFLQSQVSPTIN